MGWEEIREKEVYLGKHVAFLPEKKNKVIAFDKNLNTVINAAEKQKEHYVLHYFAKPKSIAKQEANLSDKKKLQL